MSKPILPPFAALRAFAAVGQHRGFRKAGEALGVSHAIVSRHIAALEQQLGVLLLNRNTRQLTEIGQIYHARVVQAISELQAATDSVQARSRTGLTIWCSPGFALHWLTRRLHDFGSRPNRPIIDLLATDNEPAFERAESDGDIRYCPDGAPYMGRQGVRLLELARPAVFPVASPNFLARVGHSIASAADLLRLPLIQERNDAEWKPWFAAQNVDASGLGPPIARYGQAHLTIAAARAGQGIALSNHYLVAEDLSSERLVAIRPSCPFTVVALGAYVFRSSQARWQDPALIHFRNWLKAAIAADAPTGVNGTPANLRPPPGSHGTGP
jgi:DNA-binding transcriptional LysR family regulator